MSVILLLIAFSILVAGLFLFGFLWSVKTGQFDDDVSPAVRILFDEEITTHPSNPKNPDAV
ncbi:MAG: cbb3-type cytochrome oxidase assembly protein CcoS [Bacteroidia bacterium]